MTAEEINIKALNCLSAQQWEQAQILLYKNAKENPSHETYNNLGYYLITEGLICKNGKLRNALQIGMNYLLKARNMRLSKINIRSIIVAINRLLCFSPQNQKELCEFACALLKEGLKFEKSYFLEYNLLYYTYLLRPNDTNILPQARKLMQNRTCRDTVCLYLDFLYANNYKDEGVKCAKENFHLLNDMELLMIYARFGLYENGYDLCDIVNISYNIDEFIVAATLECYLNTDHYSQVEHYINDVIKRELKDFYSRKKVKKVLKALIESEEYRKKQIANYRIGSSPIEECGYFGCAIHHTGWQIDV